jgi:tryptophanyl-tRNA synthetase
VLQSHYDAVRERHGYSTADGGSLPAPLQNLRHRFVAMDGTEVVSTALDRPTLVCAGVGMTGAPHLGTVGQLLTAIELQSAGLDVQFVLADLEPYHAGGDAEELRRLAERYRAFALELGFDTDRGVLRTQSEGLEVMASAHRLARYYDPEAWDDGEAADDGDETAAREATDWERAVEELYEAGADADSERPAPTSDAGAAHSGVLHGADFLHPLCEQGYDQILLAFGVDEHHLAPWTRQFRDAAGVSGRIGGLYTRMLPGFEGVPARRRRAGARRTVSDGVPKQSKSVDAGVSLADEPAAIHERIATAQEVAEPARSTVFQAMCLASRYGPDRLDSLATACEAGGEEWSVAREEYADYVAGLAERWRTTER